MTQWRDERDKGERDREITRWDEETGVIVDKKKAKGDSNCSLAQI